MITATRTAPNHDKLTCYANYGCRLPACVDRYNRINRERLRSQAAGTWDGLVDAQPVRDHVNDLIAAGATPHGVAIQAKVSDKAVRDLLPAPAGAQRYPAKYRMAKSTAHKILAVQITDVTAPLVDATGTVRRIQALVAGGWTFGYLAAKFGLYPKYIYELLRRVTSGETNHVAGSTARQVARVYEELRTQRPGRKGLSKQARSRARAFAESRNWPPTTYWDQFPGAIDDPHFEPMYGLTRRQLVAQDAHWLMTTNGLSKAAAAERLGVDKSYVDHALRDHPEGAAA